VFRGKSQAQTNFYTVIFPNLCRHLFNTIREYFQGIRQPTTHYEYCGSGQPDVYISSTNKVHISYTGTGGGNQLGFKLRAKMLNACARNYTSLTGRIMSYEATHCDVLISVPENYTIAVYFTSFMFYYCEQNSGLQVMLALKKIT
jgi:hypothetical protein